MKFFKLLNFIILNIANKQPVGGQAVIEGVMMRGKDKIALSVRRKDNSIDERVDNHKAYKERFFAFKFWILRGAVTLVESMVIGIRYLTYSADAAIEDEKGEKQEKSFKDSVLNSLSILFAFIVGAGIFMYLPLLLAEIVKKDQNPAVFNLTAGAIRIMFFLIYVWLISKMKDIKRVFEYHGAEHKAIYNHEAGEELTVENSRKYTTLHPRCGTSFLLIAGISCVFVFAIVDFCVAKYFGYTYPNAFYRFLVHFPLIPFVSGISYEILRFSGKFSKNIVIGKLIVPGLLLQKITTSEPSDDQLEVAISALKNAL